MERKGVTGGVRDTRMVEKSEEFGTPISEEERRGERSGVQMQEDPGDTSETDSYVAYSRAFFFVRERKHRLVFYHQIMQKRPNNNKKLKQTKTKTTKMKIRKN